jgi:hypothetical protein
MSSSHVSFWGKSGIVDLYFDTISQTALASHFGTMSNFGAVDGSALLGARYRTHGNSCKR